MTDIESFILTELVQTEDYARSALPYIKKEYFTGKESRIVFENIKNHFDKYNALPTKEALSIDISNSATLFEKEYDKTSEIVEGIYDSSKKTKQNLDWSVDKTEEWCKQRAIYNAILESAKIIDPAGKSKKPFTAIEGIVRDALSVTFDNHIGHDYFTDADSRFDFYHDKAARVPFGIDTLNEITGGGLPVKTLNIILAGVHVGKSMFMCDYAANCIRQGRRVLYITCEMAEERIAERIDANLMDIDIGDLSSLHKSLFQKQISKLKGKHSGCLKIKEYPTGSAHVGHFRALLNELAMKQNFVPEVVIVDYLNICASMRYSGDVSNSYGYVKAISEELRGLAIEFNVPILSACQVNRSAFGDSDYGMDGIAESFGINATADMILALISTEVLEKHNLLCVKQLKNRHADKGTKSRFVIAVNKAKMTFSEADDSAQSLLSAGAAGVAPGPSASPGPPKTSGPYSLSKSTGASTLKL